MLVASYYVLSLMHTHAGSMTLNEADYRYMPVILPITYIVVAAKIYLQCKGVVIVIKR